MSEEIKDSDWPVGWLAQRVREHHDRLRAIETASAMAPRDLRDLDVAIRILTHQRGLPSRLEAARLLAIISVRVSGRNR